jgi:hypothetical protein
MMKLIFKYKFSSFAVVRTAAKFFLFVSAATFLSRQAVAAAVAALSADPQPKEVFCGYGKALCRVPGDLQQRGNLTNLMYF